MSYFVAKIVFPLKFEKNLGVDLGSELVPVDLVTEWTVNDVKTKQKKPNFIHCLYRMSI